MFCLRLRQELLEAFVGGFAPAVAVFVAEVLGLGYGGHLRQVLVEVAVDLVSAAREVFDDADLVSDANIVDGEAVRVKHG